jgi:hypothetical protein
MGLWARFKTEAYISSTTWRPCHNVSADGLITIRYSDPTYINGPLRPVRVLNGGIIALNPFVVHELGCLQPLSAPKRGFRGSRVWGRAVARTSQTALSDAALSKQGPVSADAACDGWSWQEEGFAVLLRESERTHLDPKRPH